MPDFDVAALSLASPPQSAPVTSYRPAVRVKNLGIHPANVSGVCRMYRREPPGDLLQSWPLSLQNLAAGNEGNALAEGYWNPTAAEVGREFLFIAHVDVANDQNMSNNNLSPVTVLVTGAEPPPPPIIEAHATQHEDSGTDEIHVDGLAGELADPQPPKDHAARHEQGGTDELNVGGLHGTLEDPQPVGAHGNEAHDPLFVDVDQFSGHTGATTAHALASNLEKVANKGAANGYASLGADSKVPTIQLGGDTGPTEGYLRSDQTWSAEPEITPNKGAANGYADLDPTARLPLIRLGIDLPAAKGTNYIECNRDTTTPIIEASFPAGYFSDGKAIEIETLCYYRSSVPGSPSILIEFHQASPVWTLLTQPVLAELIPTFPDYYTLDHIFRIPFFSVSGSPKLYAPNRGLAIPTNGLVYGCWAQIGTPNYWADEPLTIRASLIVDDVADAFAGIMDACIRTRNPRSAT
jgi:hypothetical protein